MWLSGGWPGAVLVVALDRLGLPVLASLHDESCNVAGKVSNAGNTAFIRKDVEEVAF